MELKTYAQRVKAILAQYEKARNSDQTLYAHYVNTYQPSFIELKDGEKVVRLSNIKNLHPYESVSRARRIIQNDLHQYLPTDPDVIKARGIKEENYRNCEVREAKLI
jgi:hypothetical protein